MADLDPYHFPHPKVFLKNHETREWIIYLHKWLQQAWTKLGGSEDIIETTIIRDAYDSTMHAGAVSELEKRITCLENRNQHDYINDEALKRVEDLERSNLYSGVFQPKTFSDVTASDDYTAIPWDWVSAKNGSKITFPLSPSRGCEVIIRVSDDTSIPIDGNGRNINGSSSGVLRGKGRSVTFKYFIDDNEWFAR
jgi:hypothetical protein